MPLPDLSFRKNVTVIGIIGNTHGVNIAASPARNAMANTHHKDSLSVVVVGTLTADAAVEVVSFFGSLGTTVDTAAVVSVGVVVAVSISCVFTESLSV